MIALNRFTVLFIMLLAATLAIVQSTKCAEKSIRFKLLDIRSDLKKEIGVVRRAAKIYTKSVHRLTDEIFVGPTMNETVLAIRHSFESFLQFADRRHRVFLGNTDRSLEKASDQLSTDCPNEDVDTALEEVDIQLREKVRSRIKIQSVNRLHTIIRQQTENAIEMNRKALASNDQDIKWRVTLALRDVFALLIELFMVEIRDRQREYLAFAEQTLLTAYIQARKQTVNTY